MEMEMEWGAIGKQSFSNVRMWDAGDATCASQFSSVQGRGQGRARKRENEILNSRYIRKENTVTQGIDNSRDVECCA